MATDDESLRLEIDGPGVEQDSVDARRALELVASYFELIARIALANGTELSFRGVKVQDKCIEIGSGVSDVQAARNSAMDANRYIAGDLEPPPGTQTAVERVRNAVRKMPKDYHAKAKIGTWELPIVVDKVAPIGPPPTSVTSFRVTVIRVGGVEPRAKLRSDSEPLDFTVQLSEEFAKILGHFIYKEIDVDLAVDRDADGNITDGRVLDVHPLDDEEPGAAWKDFYERAAKEWDGVRTLDDLLRELDRD